LPLPFAVRPLGRILTRLAGTGPVVVAALGLAFTPHTGGSMAKTFHLSISGDGGARYSGACTVAVASGDERFELEGTVPLERAFDGDGLSCRFRAEGWVVVEITHNGSRSRAASSGGVIRVSAR
jgi:hypothetical protein